MTGIICLDKPAGMTSFTAVKRASGILGVKKAGHTGTLDPMATGVLVIMLSNCTRFIELLPEHKKSYLARVRLGITTDTLDITGKVLSQSGVSVTKDRLFEAAEKYKGEILQTPPMFSALKKDGERLYELARRGIDIPREQRKITVEKLEIRDFDGKDFTMEVTCSAGTYIRSLCDDIGRELGCGACMTGLRRTSANGFSIETALTLEELENAIKNGGINKCVVSLEKALEEYKAVTVTAAQAKRFYNGGALDGNRLNIDLIKGLYRVYSPEKVFLGLGEISENGGDLAVKRVFVSDE